MALRYIVKLGIYSDKDAEWFVTKTFSHNQAHHKKKMTEWKVDKTAIKNQMHLGLEFEQIFKNRLVTFSVPAEYTKAVFALQEANSNGDLLPITLIASDVPDAVIAKVEANGNHTMEALYFTGVVGHITFQEAKIADVIPLKNVLTDKLFYIVNVDGRIPGTGMEESF